MNMNRQAVAVGQALFGYREGHRLLESSIRFKPPAEKTLVALTDMSGPRMTEGFEEYISGYPVVGSDLYALVKTWYAPEMSRPGCVWSHLLLLRTSDLPEIRSARALLSMFRRPRLSNFESYATPVVAEGETSLETFMDFDASEIAALLGTLYMQDTQAETAVIVPASDSRRFERLFLELWLQQWPAFRSDSRFCSGSLSDRKLNGTSFDLQVVPSSLVTELARNPDKYAILGDLSFGKQPPESVGWTQAGAVDLRSAGGPFRDFLWRYADPCAGRRSLYRELSVLFLSISGNPTLTPNLSQITSDITSVFGEAECGQRLKRDLYGYNTREEPPLPKVDELVALTELALTPHGGHYYA